LAAVGDIAGGAVKTPLTVFEHEAGIVRELIRVLAGKSEVGPGTGDRRFVDTTWQQNSVFQRYLQGYIALTKGVNTFIGDLGLSSKKADRAKFVVALLTEAVAPTNMLLMNPAVMKKTIETRGKNLVAGFKNFAEDLLTNNGMPAQVDKKAFAVGRNLAMSTGAVVFKNEVLELIQYQPSTDEVYARPLILVPPQINKFYVYDLAPGKSMVEYLVNAGFQTFVVS
jgi:polyhydroxyalkanoate synthase subunit PhaC